MRFCFFSEYRDLKGGYTSLLISLIEGLYSQRQNLLLINYRDGLIARELEKRAIRVDIIDIETLSTINAEKLPGPGDILVITKFVEPLQYLIKADPRIIYYDINDFICDISSYKFGLKFKFLGKRLVQKLLANNSLVFMDDTGLFNLQTGFHISVDKPRFLPVPVITRSSNLYISKGPVANNEYRLTYIGRSVDWKMMPLKKILDDCVLLRGSYKIKFYVVADSRQAFEQYIDLAAYEKKGLQIELIENMEPSAIDDFLIQHSDLHFAMGTSALEAAKIGVPTILVDYSKSEFPVSYKYSWLFETQNFSLGRNLDKREVSGKHNLAALLKEIAKEDKRKELSALSYEYVSRYHSSDSIAKQLVSYAAEASLRLAAVKKYIPYYSAIHRVLKNISKVSLIIFKRVEQ